MRKLRYIAILGLGWLGLPLAKALHRRGDKVRASVNSLQKWATCHHLPFGLSRISIDECGITGDWEAFLYKTEVLIINIPPGGWRELKRFTRH